jgi:hypothetical protein
MRVRHDVAQDQAWPKFNRFDHRTGDAHAIPALRPLPTCVREAKPRLVRVSQLIPQARSLEYRFSPQLYRGRWRCDITSPDDISTRPEELESLLIGDEGFSEKGTTPESGGGIRNLAETAA